MNKCKTYFREVVEKQVLKRLQGVGAVMEGMEEGPFLEGLDKVTGYVDMIEQYLQPVTQNQFRENRILCLGASPDDGKHCCLSHLVV